MFRTQRLRAATFPGAVAATPYLLVRIDSGLPRFHRGVARYFDHQYPRLFGFGTLPLAQTKRPGWWEQHFCTAVGPARGNRAGYWLLHQGEVVGNHSGIVRADLDYDDPTLTLDDWGRGQAEIAWLKQIAFENTRVSQSELAIAVEIIAYFDAITLERQSRSGFDSGSSSTSGSAGGGGARVETEAIVVAGGSGDPFEVLKVSHSATDEEIRAAYKQAMKLNHPDKVSHMSEEIQTFANAQVRGIRAAYDAIKRVRRG